MDGFLEILSENIKNSVWLAPLFAFIAGVVTSFTPCSLSSVPLIIGYVGGTGQNDTKKAMKLSIVFVIGSAITFTTLGLTATIIGNLVGMTSRWWFIALGILMILMAFQTWEIFEIIPSSYLNSKNKKKGYLGALISGILGGLFSSPCSTPVLIALLAIVAGKGSFIWGAVLLLLYSLGHGVLAIIAGTSFGYVQKLSQNERYLKFGGILKKIMGFSILLIGFYMFYLGF